MRLGVLLSHPIQYHAPLFRAIQRKYPEVDLHVYFCHDHGVGPTFDPGFGKEIQFDTPLLEGYAHTFLKNVSPRPGLSIVGMINPDLWSAIQDRDVLIVFGYNRPFTWLPLLRNRLKGSPKLLLRGDSQLTQHRSPAKKLVKDVLLRSLLGAFDGCIASGTLNRAYYEHYGASTNRIFFAPFSSDNLYFSSHKDDVPRGKVRQDLGFLADDVVFLVCSKLIPLKQIHIVLQALARIQHRGAKNARVLIVGSGPEEERLRSLTGSLDLVASVNFAGFRNQSELPQMYSASDALILASETEAWGLVVNEAMACGLPAIVSDQVGCAPDLVEGTGIVFPVGNVERLADAMVHWTLDKEALALAKTRATQRIDAWSTEKTADGFVEAAERILALQ